jgi:hypothetical protein
MLKQAVIHYPADETALKHIHKELAAFRCSAVVNYIKTLNLTDGQIELLYNDIEKEINAKQTQIA